MRVTICVLVALEMKSGLLDLIQMSEIFQTHNPWLSSSENINSFNNKSKAQKESDTTCSPSAEVIHADPASYEAGGFSFPNKYFLNRHQAKTGRSNATTIIK